MFSNLDSFPDEHSLECDLCIVGGGAAGISIAREFADTALKICLIESSAEYHQPSQLLYDADQRPLKRARSIKEGVHYGAEAIHSRLRFFGGSTNHWGGYCVPLTPHDLETHDWMPESGWPIDWAELSRFYPRAQALCEAGPFVYDETLWQGTGVKHYDFDGSRLQNRFYQFSPPTRFGDRYGDELRRARNIEIIFNANATNIGLRKNARSAKSVTVKSFSGKQATVRARHFIVACGGIENARLLLASDDVATTGVGNVNDLVGRYFMDHLYDSVGSLLVSARPDRLLQQYAQITSTNPAHPSPAMNRCRFRRRYAYRSKYSGKTGPGALRSSFAEIGKPRMKAYAPYTKPSTRPPKITRRKKEQPAGYFVQPRHRPAGNKRGRPRKTAGPPTSTFLHRRTGSEPIEPSAAGYRT